MTQKVQVHYWQDVLCCCLFKTLHLVPNSCMSFSNSNPECNIQIARFCILLDCTVKVNFPSEMLSDLNFYWNRKHSLLHSIFCFPQVHYPVLQTQWSLCIYPRCACVSRVYRAYSLTRVPDSNVERFEAQIPFTRLPLPCEGAKHIKIREVVVGTEPKLLA